MGEGLAAKGQLVRITTILVTHHIAIKTWDHYLLCTSYNQWG
ncbi:hypothetical protein B4064_3323 [Caldibacillus thermoamylovorans]|nr:hypothetical protein B4064_3323 [Caldibacillus thermoamylovorans]